MEMKQSTGEKGGHGHVALVDSGRSNWMQPRSNLELSKVTSVELKEKIVENRVRPHNNIPSHLIE